MGKKTEVPDGNELCFQEPAADHSLTRWQELLAPLDTSILLNIMRRELEERGALDYLDLFSSSELD